MADKRHTCALPSGGLSHPYGDMLKWTCPTCWRTWIWTPKGGWR